MPKEKDLRQARVACVFEGIWRTPSFHPLSKRDSKRKLEVKIAGGKNLGFTCLDKSVIKWKKKYLIKRLK